MQTEIPPKLENFSVAKRFYGGAAKYYFT